MALRVFDDGTGPALIAGGRFTLAGGGVALRLAQWDGQTWSPLSGGLHGPVQTLEVFDDGTGTALYAGGFFSSPELGIARWNGSIWSPVGAGLSPDVRGLAVFDDGTGAKLYAGLAGPGQFVMTWNGASWSQVGSGTTNLIADALEVFDDGTGPSLYVGGRDIGAAAITYEWDGSAWSSFGSFQTGEVLAFAAFDDGFGGGESLFAGGSFELTNQGDSYLAEWGCSTPGATFCTAKSQLICGPAHISASGTPSTTATSGFVVQAGPVRGCRAGLLLYSSQPVVAGASFGGLGNGLLCLNPAGLRRAGPIDSGGTSPQACDGVLAIDMNQFGASAWIATGCAPAPGQNNPAGFLGSLGTLVHAQLYGRDSTTTGQVLSDGVRWTVAP